MICLIFKVFKIHTSYMTSFNSFNIRKQLSHRCGAVIFNDNMDKIVLILNRYSSEVLKKPKWGLPKGHINKKVKEAYIKCAEREVLEETGLNIKMDKKNGMIRVNKTNYYLIRLSNEFSLKPKDTYEVSEAKWIDIKDIKNMVINYECKLVMEKLNRFKTLARLNRVNIIK